MSSECVLKTCSLSGSSYSISLPLLMSYLKLRLSLFYICVGSFWE